MERLAFRNFKSRGNNRLNEAEPLRSACYFSACFTCNLNDYMERYEFPGWSSGMCVV
jgi:hypothetical protein